MALIARYKWTMLLMFSVLSGFSRAETYFVNREMITRVIGALNQVKERSNNFKQLVFFLSFGEGFHPYRFNSMNKDGMITPESCELKGDGKYQNLLEIMNANREVDDKLFYDIEYVHRSIAKEDLLRSLNDGHSILAVINENIKQHYINIIGMDEKTGEAIVLDSSMCIKKFSMENLYSQMKTVVQLPYFHRVPTTFNLVHTTPYCSLL